MRMIETFPGGKARKLVRTCLFVMGVAFIWTSNAKADMAEYWTRETFKTQKPTTASFFEQQDRRQNGTTYRSQEKRLAAPSKLGGPETERPRKVSRNRSKGVRVASLGNSYVPAPKPEKSVSGGGGIRWLASASCLDGGLRSILAQVASRFGSVTVNSTCRSRAHNRRVGGASRSKHLTGDAADFRVHGNVRGAAAFLRSRGGGYKHYGGGLFHIDNGPTRTW